MRLVQTPAASNAMQCALTKLQHCPFAGGQYSTPLHLCLPANNFLGKAASMQPSHHSLTTPEVAVSQSLQTLSIRCLIMLVLELIISLDLQSVPLIHH